MTQVYRRKIIITFLLSVIVVSSNALAITGQLANELEKISSSNFQPPTIAQPTATDSALNMRLQNKASAKPINLHPATAFDAVTTQGERLFIGIGGTAYTEGHESIPVVEPNEQGGIQAKYITSFGTLANLPPLGTTSPRPAPPNRFHFNHEGTNVGAVTAQPNGDVATHILVMDGWGSPSLSYRFIQSPNGNQRMEELTLDGIQWSTNDKNHALDTTNDGLVVMHGLGTPYPSIIVDGDYDGDFHPVQHNLTPASPQLVLRLGRVGNTMWLLSAIPSVGLSKITRNGNDSAVLEQVIEDLNEFWGDQFQVNANGFGATAKYLGPAANQPGFVVYSTSSKLDYHNGQAGAVKPVDDVAAYTYQNIKGVTWRITAPELLLQRLESLQISSSSAIPTWVTEADLEPPPEWVSVDIAEITDSGSVWLIGRKDEQFPNNAVVDDIAVAYYKGGSPANANILPTIELLSPSNPVTLQQGDSLILEASAEDSDGRILYVSFYANENLLGEDFTEPYEFNYAPTSGLHIISAMATDNELATKTSNTQTITVNASRQILNENKIISSEWSIFSTAINIQSTDLNQLFGEGVIVRSIDGKISVPPLGINTIGSYDVRKAYWTKSTGGEQNIYLSGEINLDTRNLEVGWNLISTPSALIDNVNLPSNIVIRNSEELLYANNAPVNDFSSFDDQTGYLVWSPLESQIIFT